MSGTRGARRPAPRRRPVTQRWAKTPPEIADRFQSALPADVRVERRTMFGYPCAFAGGHMFAGTHEHRIVVRLGPADHATLLAEPGAEPFAPMGRVMREYVVVPPSVVRRPTALAAWLARGFGFASTLQPRRPRPPARSKRSR